MKLRSIECKYGLICITRNKLDYPEGNMGFNYDIHLVNNGEIIPRISVYDLTRKEKDELIQKIKKGLYGVLK